MSVATSFIVGRPCHFNIVFRCLGVSPWKVVNACLNLVSCSLVNVTLPSEFHFQSEPYGSGISCPNNSHIVTYILLVFVTPCLCNNSTLYFLPLEKFMALRVLFLNAIFFSSVYLSNKSDSNTLLTHLGTGGVILDSVSLEDVTGLDSSTLTED